MVLQFQLILNTLQHRQLSPSDFGLVILLVMYHILKSIQTQHSNTGPMVRKISLETAIKENAEFGFDRNLIQIAYKNVDGNGDRIIDQIFRLQSDSSQFPSKPINPGDEDAQLSKAIEASMSQAKDKKIILQPLNPQQRVRKSGVPVGLKNIGNTCYFNSLLQTYFQNWAFAKEVLNYQIPERYKEKGQSQQKKINNDDYEMKRKQASCKLVENLKILFAYMIATDRKYADPTAVISAIVDDYGNQLPIGDQKDIGQFNLVFLSRVDQGLSLAKKQKMMDVQNLQLKKSDESPSKIQSFGQSQHSINSILRRSSIKIDEQSIVAKQFFGKIRNSYQNSKENIHISEDELFSLLFLNVKYRQMYRACEQVAISHIDDYRNQKGEIVGVEKQSWINQAPKTLFFQIDRVIFNKEKCVLQKINSIFDFPKVFYVDPFLLNNKEKALQIQKRVRSLRQEKEEYQNALTQLESFGEKGINLLDLLVSTTEFLKKQGNAIHTEKETQNAAFFPNLKHQVTDNHINLLINYKQAVEARINKYHQKIRQIQKEIQTQYSLIRSVPYYLYSLLIHEGSADSGHYYSYTYDFDAKVWRKYNDINISEEAEEQVIKEAKGINYTSAYYLVYAQKQVLHPEGVLGVQKSWKLSSEEGYMEDHFSSFISFELKSKVRADNQQMYYDIQQYKMAGFVTRVIEAYSKKFQTCNQTFRKKKTEKKKNNPPMLINFPIFVKYVLNDEQYKNVLMENSINDYGPKQFNPVFQEMVQKKLVNFNDFKRPKQLHGTRPEMIQTFMKNIYRAVASKKLYNAIKESEYQGVVGLLKELKSAQSEDYFQWVGNLVAKTLIVRFLIEAEENVREKSEIGIQKLRFLVVILFNFINLQEEKALINNCIFWIAEIATEMTEPQKSQAEKISELINGKQYKNEYCELLENKLNETMVSDIKNGIEFQDAIWNLSRKENTFIDEMIDARNQTKDKMEVANLLYKEMKKENLQLKKEHREKIKHSAFGKP